MEIVVLDHIPAHWKDKKPLREYETRYIYIGFSRYDTETKTLSNLRIGSRGEILYSESPHSATVLPRAYTTELVRVSVYSESPRVWCETLSPTQQHFFQQKV